VSIAEADEFLSKMESIDDFGLYPSVCTRPKFRLTERAPKRLPWRVQQQRKYDLKQDDLRRRFTALLDAQMTQKIEGEMSIVEATAILLARKKTRHRK
jgi:hypothetical protein